MLVELEMCESWKETERSGLDSGVKRKRVTRKIIFQIAKLLGTSPLKKSDFDTADDALPNDTKYYL